MSMGMGEKDNKPPVDWKAVVPIGGGGTAVVGPNDGELAALRAENAALRSKLSVAREALGTLEMQVMELDPDTEADPNNKSPKDMTQHIAGLLLRIVDSALEKLKGGI